MSGLILGGWNEVVVDSRGNAYVNSPNFDMSHGFDFEVGSTSGVIAVVSPGGDARLVALALFRLAGHPPTSSRTELSALSPQFD